MSLPPSRRQATVRRRLYASAAVTAGVMLLLLLATAVLYIRAGEPRERLMRQRGCLLCHTDGFRPLLPSLQTWQAGLPLRQPLRQQLQATHPLLTGGGALDPLTDELYARQLAALAATRQQESGKNLYLAKCAACHGREGQGQPGLYPPLQGSEWLTTPPSRLPEILSKGLRGPIMVKGEPWDSIMLPPGLTDEEQQPLIRYLRATMP